MQLTGKLVQLLPLQSGTGKNGEWKKQDIILEMPGKFPKKVCVSIWGDRIDAQLLRVGNELRIDFDVESREYNSRWYTDVKAWKLELVGAQSPTSPMESSVGEVPPPGADDEIPF